MISIEVDKGKLTKIVSRAMEDVRGLDDKFPNEEDAEELAEILNGILDDAVEKIIKLISVQG